MYGYRARIGYTSPPSATEVFPYEFYKIVPDGVTLVVHTLPLTDKSGDEIDRSYDTSLTAAKVMARAGVDVVLLGGVPILASRGFDSIDSMAEQTAADIGVPVLTSFGAQRGALRALGAKKVASVQPYTEDHGPRFEEYLVKLGCEPTGSAGVGAIFQELGKVDVEDVRKAAHRVLDAYPESDTLHIPCPHFSVIEIIDEIERERGVSVVTALQSIAWHALRATGVDDKIDGYGRLFREH